MDKYRMILQEWRRAAIRSEVDDHLTFSSPPWFHSATVEFLRTKEYALVATLYESRGTSDFLYSRAVPVVLPMAVLQSLGSLVLAAHFFRLAGEIERSVMTGTRALFEIKAFLAREESGAEPLPEAYLRWYVLEMAGDAAVCTDRLQAITFYKDAENGFRGVNPIDQASDAQEGFPGSYQRALTNPVLLPGFPDILLDKGVDRVRYKLRHWVRI